MTDLGDIGGSAVNAVMERVGRGVSRMQERKPLPYDLLESDDAYLVVFDAPGIESSDVQVRFVEGEVQVRADRFRAFNEGFEMRFPGRGLALSGRAKLPPDAMVDAQDADATLADNGTLEVWIPKDGTGTDVPVSNDEEAESAETDGSDAEDDTGADDADSAGSDPDIAAADESDDA